MALKSFKHYLLLPVSPDEVFLALTIPVSIELWSGEPAEMSAVEGAEFSLFNGNIVGKNLEIIPDQLIRQEWYIEDSPFSEVMIKLHPHKKGCSLEVQHHGIPEERFEEFSDGWKNLYLASLEEFF